MRRMLFAVVLLLSLSVCASAQDPVHFDDARLKAAVEWELYISDPTPDDMLGLLTLICPNSEDRIDAITDLAGLEYAVNLQRLDLESHSISDLSPLSGLINLRTLNLEHNELVDISALSGLISLESVNLHRNHIREILPLTSLTQLKEVDLRLNPLNRSTYGGYLAQIRANNPGVWLFYNAYCNCRVVVSSGGGGSVIRPGEGEFTYPIYEEVRLEAKADPCFVFVGWSGSYSTSANPLLLTLEEDCHLQANFGSALSTIHVDDNAPGDPGPGNGSVSDPQENGAAAHPFDRIQEAIDVAADGASIFVHAGTYREIIDLPGKRLTVTGFSPDDPSAASWPVIDGGGTGLVVCLTGGEGSDSVLSGLVITGGWGRSIAAVYCPSGNLTMLNCLIVGNVTVEPNSAPMYFANSDVTLVNCTISGNQAGPFGAALYAVDSRVTVVNSILWGNTPVEILARGTYQPLVHYSTVKGGWLGMGCTGNDPLFVRPGHWAVSDQSDAASGPDDPNAVWVMGDYHLQSRARRYDPGTQTWVRDRVTSPGIDAGDPNHPVGWETLPNGGIVNVGAYGGTVQASKSAL